MRESVYRWGPTEQRCQHRLNNLAALLDHAQEYMNQCTAQHQPASSAGLVLWLYQLAEAEEDTQATGGAENAIQLVTHHGAKGLEWPIVVAMDLTADLKPRLWGLSVLPSPTKISLDDPLAGRTLRYWPAFTGLQSANIPLLEQIKESPKGLAAMAEEIQESRRLLYVSLTRPRDGLIITLENKQTGGGWMDTLDADWMLPEGDTLALPDGELIPSRYLELEAPAAETAPSDYKPNWLINDAPAIEKLPLRLSPSSFPPIETAKIGEIIELGDRLEITGDYDPATLGSALHAVIATRLMGQNFTQRALAVHGMEATISVEAADECANRLVNVINQRFKATTLYTEYPVYYTTATGQLVSGWIDLLIETEEGFVLIDHKASPRGESDWEEVALGYSGQMQAYGEGIQHARDKPVIGKWIHFAIGGGLVELAQ
ncbi:3'-5' exonuclease [Pseudomonadota bacterium]